MPFPRHAVAAAAAALLCGAPAARAQVVPANDSTPAAAAPNPVEPSLPLAAPLVDAPVSRSAYVLGPGDVLSVAVFGDFSQVFTLPVSPEGTVVIPEMGIARVLGLNLDQAEEQVRRVVARLYRGVEVTVTLSRIRTFKVFLVGDVNPAGVRVATAATRVSEILPFGMSAQVRRRNLVLRRAGGDSIHVDLTRFYQMGDASANPMLREGDAVVVPVLTRKIEVMGTVQYPGSYEFRPGETLAQLLNTANGGAGFPPSASDTLRLVRFDEAGERREHRFTQAEAMGPRGQGFAMAPFDAVFVSTMGNYKVHTIATIEGEVVNPGTYPIRSDTTTVRELVQMAGGFTPRASLTSARLERLAPPAQRGETELQNIPPELLTTEERQILQVRNLGNSSTVVIDFRQLFAAGSDASLQTLRSGDKVTVPERRSEVVVLGAVREPGIQRFIAGTTVSQYVARAGGATRRADLAHAVVVRARTGARESVGEATVVEEGDTVILPFRRDTDWQQVLQTAGTLISAVTGLVISAVAIFR